ncbi:KamA family radical SAM protein [Thermosulfurimonas marina]|uniref:KamA family radical SAM protein n=1 Tax=Thermosulfurimonas marina TaxID=2047767 RepID=A0A6H1WUG7_9BACT|nr:KamA family radical SAM protein [Thermosulfurimonas marina]QJA06821.1 KamA family radical SAM protein [Thermosulfurimonas marina]
MPHKVSFVRDLEELPLSAEEKERLRPVAEKYPFFCSSYYLRLINFKDPADPLRRVVVPEEGELESWGRVDPSNEANYTVMEGVQHKYDSTVLVLASDRCAALCRYCFRKRLFLRGSERRPERLRNLRELVRYLEGHPEVSNVIFSGGDALMLSTSRIKELLEAVIHIPHIRYIRFGSRLFSYWPERILNDPQLLELFRRYSRPGKRLYVVTHFDHPRELTAEARKACDLLLRAGVHLLNQCPLIRGVNDHPVVLAELFRELAGLGVSPYYVFQCRPTLGNRPYAVPIEEGYTIFEKARGMVSGVAKRVRFVMSHALGKLEIAALTRETVIFKFHRAARNTDTGKVLVYARHPEAYWLDDYSELVEEVPLEGDLPQAM